MEAQLIQKKGFSIVIPSWNNLPYLKNCIKSIRNNSSISHQIIVHINEGKDGTLDWVRLQEDLDFTYSEKNIGVCFALNKARTLVSRKYIVYLNDDMYLCPGWDTALLLEINYIGHDMFFLSSTVIEPTASSNCVIEKDYGTDINNFDEALLLKDFQNLTISDWSGSTWPPNILPVSLWDFVGGYSVEFSPGMYSDPDFSMKLWNAGVRYFKGVANSKAYHFGSLSVKRVKKNKGYYQFINKWGFTSSVLTKNILHRGELFLGNLPDYKISIPLKLKNSFKRLIAAFYR